MCVPDMDAAKAEDGEVPDFSSVVADMINDEEGLVAASTPLLQLNSGWLVIVVPVCSRQCAGRCRMHGHCDADFHWFF